MRMRAALAAACIGWLLSACDGSEQAESPAAPENPLEQAVVADGVDAGSATTGQPVAAPEAHLAGFGPLRLGMTILEAEAAWPGLFERVANATSRTDCFHAGVDGLSHFGLMFDGGRFVRYGGSIDTLVAPGGGKRGMDEAALRALYHGALDEAPDRFAAGGNRLSFDTSGVAPSRLVFLLRPDGMVNEWYVGLHPQIDYESGCEDAG